MKEPISWTPAVPDGPDRPWTRGRRTRWWLVVPADVATRPGHVLVTEVLRGGQVHFLVPQSVPSLAMMWRHPQPVPPQEHS